MSNIDVTQEQNRQLAIHKSFRELRTEIDKLKTMPAANVGSAIHAAGAKTTPVDADTMPLIDSAAGNILKKVTWANIKATLKPYFDTLYGLLATANSWTQNQTIASTQTTGNALRVIRNLTATSTDAAVVDLIQDHASDDQPVLRVQQDGTGDIFDIFDGATRVLRLVDGGRLDAYNIIRALTASGLRLEDDGGNLVIEIVDGGSVNLYGATMHRVTTSTSLLRQSALLKITTSGAAADGFGPAFFFDLNDSDTSGSNPIGAIGAVRAGADNNGDIVIYTYLAGVGSEVARITKDGRVGVQQATPTAAVDAPAGTTARAPLRLRHGVAPTTPNDGDVWTTTAGMFVRINGVTKTVTLT